MARRIRANVFDRRSRTRFIDRLKEKELPEDWAPHLYHAWLILNSELRIPSQSSKDIVIVCVEAAHDYLGAQSQQLRQIVEGRSQEVVLKAATQVANCIKGAPAAVRRSFNTEVLPLIQVSTIDLEVIESLFDAAESILNKCPSYKRSEGALKAIKRLQIEFPALGIDPRQRAETAIAALGKPSKSKQAISADDVFYVLADSLNGPVQTRPTTRCCALIRDYVYEVGAVWCRAGLWPGRAADHMDPTYKSRFHRFAELVLTEVVEPNARRHLDCSEALRQEIRKAHTRLPAEIRPSVSSAGRRMDYEWLITDRDVKHAQARLKTAPQKAI
jgi:hypothetical protein